MLTLKMPVTKIMNDELILYPHVLFLLLNILYTTAFTVLQREEAWIEQVESYYHYVLEPHLNEFMCNK